MVDAPTSAGESYKILHLSDLHFGGAFDAELWDYVKAVVKEEKPRLIVVTGDLVETPSPLLLLQAKRELKALTAEIPAARLLVIPGNHDIAVKGNLFAPYLSRLFWRVFANDTAAIETSLPATPWIAGNGARPTTGFARTRRLKSWIRDQWRSGMFLSKRRLSCPPPGVALEPFSDDRVFVLPFDSNAKVMLATGYVGRGEIYSAAAKLDTAAKQRQAPFVYALRIAIVHHHPAPVPFAIVKEGALSFEPFLVFRNAGEFLRLLSTRSFDLVLHGHHHYHNFTRLAFGAEGCAPEMGILAAGSATTRYDQAGRNSFNLLSIAPNGRVDITPFFIGGGLTSEKPQSFTLHTTEGLKLRNYERAVNLHELKRDEVRFRWDVDEFGTQRMNYAVRGLSVTGSYTTDSRTFEVKARCGRPVKSSIMLHDGHTYFLEEVQPEEDDEIRRQIRFGRTLTARSKPVDYTLSWRTHNCMMLTKWEAEQRRADSVQRLYFVVGFPTRRLSLTLRLPEELADLRPGIKCLMPAGYPNLALNVAREVEPASWETDSEMSDFESGNFRNLDSGLWTLDIDHPMIGYKYMIEWDLASRRDEGSSPRTAGEVRMYRDMLLRYGEQRRNDGPPNSVTAILKQFLRDLRRRYGSVDPNEQITLSLMAYDEDSRRLCFVDAVWTGTRAFDWDFSLELGDGVSGASFKQRKSLMFDYHAIVETLDEAYRRRDGTNYAALLATPVFHPRERDTALTRQGALPDDTIGVLTIGSTSPGTGLLKLIDETRSTEEGRRFRKFWGVSQLVFEAILATVRQETQPQDNLLKEEVNP